MIPISVPNRPFSTEPLTGLMLPDGIFEASIGAQGLNAQFKNAGAVPTGTVQIYIESVSNPGIVISPQTHSVTALAGGASRALAWTADFSGAPAGVHFVSFIAKSGANQVRIIKKIFVTRITYDPATKSFSATTPEGVLSVNFRKFLAAGKSCCCGTGRGEKDSNRGEVSLIARLAEDIKHLPRDVRFCLPAYLFSEVDLNVSYTPPFAGQYSDLPFQDPWWKILLAIIACLLLIAAAIAEAVGGSGDLTATTGGTVDTSGSTSCSCSASGGGTSYIAAGLVAAAAAVATAAALSDDRDPFRRGQDHTLPATGEHTVAEKLRVKITYPESVALGRPFAAQAKWRYTRVTTGASYDYAGEDTRTNKHVLSRYNIEAPNYVRLYTDEPWIIRGQFFGPDDDLMRGDQLFVQCFLVGPKGQFYRFPMQDDGIAPDQRASDGWYTGAFDFRVAAREEETDARGFWHIFVLAQDVNNAAPDLKPEQAAQIIGGLVRTHQLSITWGGGTCPLTPDGEVNVV